jgi:hypothetical protein
MSSPGRARRAKRCDLSGFTGEEEISIRHLRPETGRGGEQSLFRAINDFALNLLTIPSEKELVCYAALRGSVPLRFVFPVDAGQDSGFVFPASTHAPTLRFVPVAFQRIMLPRNLTSSSTPRPRRDVF